jgi:uncharacterized protein
MAAIKNDIKAGQGSFFIEENDKRAGEMVVGVQGNNLTVFHTEVAEEFKGKGIGQELLAAMVNYARQHNYRVIPRCSFVHTYFRKSPDKYKDIWNEKDK